LHLVGILFPHINDDARSKSHKNSECSQKKSYVPFVSQNEFHSTKWLSTFFTIWRISFRYSVWTSRTHDCNRRITRQTNERKSTATSQGKYQ